MDCNIRLVSSIFRQANFFRNRDSKYHKIINLKAFYDDIQEEIVEAFQVARQLNDFLSNTQPSVNLIPQGRNFDHVEDYDVPVDKNLGKKSNTKCSLHDQNFYFELSGLRLPVEDEYLLGKRLMKFFSFIALVRPSKLFISRGEIEYFGEEELDLRAASFELSSEGKIVLNEKQDYHNILKQRAVLNKIRCVEINICSLLILARSFESSDPELLNVLLIIVTFQSEFFQLCITDEEVNRAHKCIFDRKEYIYLLYFTIIRSKQELVNLKDVDFLNVKQRFKNEIEGSSAMLSEFEAIDHVYLEELKHEFQLLFESPAFIENYKNLLRTMFSYDELRHKLVDLGVGTLRTMRETCDNYDITIDLFEEMTFNEKYRKFVELQNRVSVLTAKNELMENQFAKHTEAKDETIEKLNLIIDDLRENIMSLENRLSQTQIGNAKRLNRFKDESNREINTLKENFKKDMAVMRMDVFNEGKNLVDSHHHEHESREKSQEVEVLRAENANLKRQIQKMIYQQEHSARAYHPSYGVYEADIHSGYDEQGYYYDYRYKNGYFNSTDGTPDQPIAVDDEEALHKA